MDSAACNVIYVDRNVRAGTQITPTSTTEDIVAALGDAVELESSLSMLRDAFGEVHVCATGVACIEKLLYLHDASMVELKPTLVLIDIPYDEQIVESPPPSRDPSPHSRKSADALQSGQGDQELYGLRLLERIVYELHSRNLTRLVVPIPVVSSPSIPSAPLESEDAETRNPVYQGYPNQPPQLTAKSLPNRALLRKCLDSGAADVMASPLHVKTLATLEVHAYRAHKEAVKEQQALMELRRGRKRSWVGVHEEKPFAYLREAMVSGLMGGICRSGEESDDVMIGSMRINVSPDQKAMIADALGKWNFCAHDFGDDQLLIVASLIFKHAFTMPELEPWRIPTDQLTTFLVACRAAYNGFVPYHNFRHAVDVLQATFNFLVQIGSLPPYPLRNGMDTTPMPKPPKSPLATLLQPFEALTLLISAIGHDVGHPGVNNGFLVTLNAPLAQLYNDRSVLESFHCAAFSQILRRYWPAAFENTKMRSLMISSILATDMGLHFDYMTKLESLQEKLHKKNSTEEWNGRTVEKETALACALLIKCADISNVARGYDTALKWMHILCDEFSRQASMESQIGISSSLISEPKKDFLSLAKAQIGFMNLFAIPLFQGVSDVLPAMKYTIEALEGNQNNFEEAIEEIREMDEECKRAIQDGARSPRTVTMAVSMGDSIDSSSGKTLEAPAQNMPECHSEMKQAGSSPPDQPQRMPGEYDEMNGMSGDYDPVAEFAASDPFHMHDGENRMMRHRGKQRSSETTEGSNSAPYSGDWASQATSATTGKMPLSPSTQGTSIISQESLEQPPTTIPPSPVEAPEPDHLPLPLPPMERANSNEEHSNGSTLKMDMSPGPARSPSADKSLKKKPSRFRMNALKLFRRDKSSSPSPSGETGG